MPDARRLPRLLLLAALLVAVSTPEVATAQEAPRAAGPPVALVGSEAEPFAHAAWAPDGRRLAFSRPSYDGLWVADADGGALRQLTDEAGAGFGVAWAPGGDALLARVARYDGPRRADAVKVFDLAADTARLLTDYRPRMATLPRWQSAARVVLLRDGGAEALDAGLATPAGRDAARPVYAEHPASGLVVVRPDGRRARYLEGERVVNATASPDGQRVAFEIVGGHLHVMNADGSGLVDLGRGHRPTWSPDGAWVAFMRTEDDGYAFTAADLFAVRADGTDPVRLTATPDRLEMNPAWAPDGAAIAFDDHAGTIYRLPLAR